NRAHIHAEQLRHQLLCQPNGVIFIPRLNALLARLTGKDQKFCCAVTDEFAAHWTLACSVPGAKRFITKRTIKSLAFGSLSAISKVSAVRPSASSGSRMPSWRRYNRNKNAPERLLPSENG